MFEGAFNAPMIWNSNFFQTEEAMKLLRLTMDVWLPDFKFGPGRCALELARTGWYWDTVTRNLLALRDWREEILAAFRRARERGLRFESLSYERNQTGVTL